MKKIFAVFFALLIFAAAAEAELPKNYKEFKARYQKEATSPEGAVKLYFEGVFVFMNNETRSEGAKMIRYSLRSEVPIERSTYYSTFVERMKDPIIITFSEVLLSEQRPKMIIKCRPIILKLISLAKP